MSSIFSFKFMKKGKSIAESGDCDSPFGSPRILRRRASSADAASLEQYIKLQELRLQHSENDQKKHKNGMSKTRKKSYAKKLYSDGDDEILHHAVINENTGLVKHILSSDNVNVNNYRDTGWTTLHHACRLGNIEIIKLLLDAGANASLPNRDGSSPLRLAVIYGNFDAAIHLIHEQGVSCDEIRDGFQEKNPPAMMSAIKKHLKNAKT